MMLIAHWEVEKFPECFYLLAVCMIIGEKCPIIDVTIDRNVDLTNFIYTGIAR